MMPDSRLNRGVQGQVSAKTKRHLPGPAENMCVWLRSRSISGNAP